MRTLAPSLARQNLACAVALGLVLLSAPFPSIQIVLHAMLVLALAPRPGAPLVGALWALAAGWTLEGSLRFLPHLGGTAWADLTMALLAGWVANRWPPEELKGWLGRLTAFSVAHSLVMHGAVRLATVPHPWGWGWFWTLLSVPLWGWLTWRVLHQSAGSGRR
jgi:hypothetical protein